MRLICGGVNRGLLQQILSLSKEKTIRKVGSQQSGSNEKWKRVIEFDFGRETRRCDLHYLDRCYKNCKLSLSAREETLLKISNVRRKASLIFICVTLVSRRSDSKQRQSVTVSRVYHTSLHFNRAYPCHQMHGFIETYLSRVQP